jgi:hypothetical protein
MPDLKQIVQVSYLITLYMRTTILFLVGSYRCILYIHTRVYTLYFIGLKLFLRQCLMLIT